MMTTMMMMMMTTIIITLFLLINFQDPHQSPTIPSSTSSDICPSPVAAAVGGAGTGSAAGASSVAPCDMTSSGAMMRMSSLHFLSAGNDHHGDI